MIIRKEFSVESAHIVRNCTSERCSHSIHGHSARIELFFESEKLDNAQMVIDFGLMKTSIKNFIDSFDHCYLLCEQDNNDFKKFIREYSTRYIAMNFNPSAEMLSLFIFKNISDILKNTHFNNGEDSGVRLKAVRYHETSSGYAECDQRDVDTLWKPEYDTVMYSQEVVKDWDEQLKSYIFTGEPIENPTVEKQIDLI